MPDKPKGNRKTMDRSPETSETSNHAAPTTCPDDILQDVLDTIPVRVFWKDRLGVYLGCNQHFITDAGKKSQKEIIGKTDFDMAWKDQADIYRRDDFEVMESGQPKLNYEEPQTTPRGELILLRTSKIPLRDSTGTIYGVMGTYEDITERKQAEESLRKANIQAELESARTRAILDSMAEGLVVADPNGNIIEMNPAGLSIHEFGSLDEVYRHLMEYPDLFDLHVEDGSLIPVEEWPMAKALRGEVFTGYELWVTRKDTGSKWIARYSGAPVRDGHGNIIMAVITLEDITESKHAEKTLRESEARYRELVQNANSAIIRWKADGTLTFFNEYAQTFFGYSADEVIGKHVGMLVPQEESTGADLSDLVRDIVANPERYVNNINENVRKDGSRAWMSWTNKPIFDTEGKVIEILAVGTDITERKRAEEALRESEEKFRSVFENSSLGIFRSTMEGLFLDVNPAIARMLGYDSPGELKRETGSIGAQLYVHPEQRKEIVRRLAAEGEVLNEEVQYRRKDGVIVTGRINVKAVRDGSGRVTHLEGFVDDITEQKHLEDELRESRTILKAAVTSIPDAVFISDAEGRFIHTNEAFATYHRFRNMEECSRTIARCPDTLEAFFKDRTPAPPNMWAVPRALRGEVVINTEYRLRRKDTREEWVGSYSFAPIRNEDGKIIGSVVIARDVTDEKHSEEALRESEFNFRTLAENISQFAWMTDEKGWIFWYNKQWYDYTGTTFEQMQGWGWRKVHHPDHVERVVESFSRSLMTGEVWEDMFPLRRKDGEYRWFLSRAIPIRDEHGKVLRWFGTNTDITELKRIEEELRNLTGELEQRVEQRTEELKQANRAKDQFLANMSHEIRTPMAGVLGLTEILLHQELPANVQDDLAMIRSSAGSVMTLINDLFDLSRVNQGKFDFHPEEFDLRSMVQDAIRPLEFQAHSKDFDFSVSFDESVPSQILCDKDRLGQVLKNLVSNAIKFTKQGYVRVHVHAEKNDEDTLRLNFAVSDSGLGIPRNKQKDVFNAFTQLDPSYSKKFAGMGLGLAISKSLVEGMGGEISVESTRGKGATFRFHVTCGIMTEEQESTAPSITLQDLPPMTILIAEDNAVNRLFLRRALVTSGHKVGEAENGRHALRKLKDTHFDLVLMDIQMPEMDGLEAMQRIRSGKHGRADIPIIALTAYAMKGDREKFLENGMDGYVTKPVDFGELARVISEVCGREESTG
jgi:PAS domain S-box-containing protein